jgi:Ca2+-binding RTX toxin-like protein
MSAVNDSIGNLETLFDDMSENVTRYWTGLTAAISESSEFLERNANISAAQYRAYGDRMLDLASDYARGISTLADGGGLAAERAAIRETGSEILRNIESIRNSGVEAIESYGRSVADAAQQGARRVAGELAGPVVDVAVLSAAVNEARDSGIWTKVGETAAGVGAAAALGKIGAAVGAAAAVALGIAAGPTAAVVFVVAAGFAFLGDLLGPIIFRGWNQIAELVRSFFDDSKRFVTPSDPFVLDLDGDGIETSSLSDSVSFDHDNDGISTRTGWVGSDDVLLARDLNADGSISSGRELFGDNTILPSGALATNGFAALAALDANEDGVIDSSDPAFAELRIWQDANQDGVSQAPELRTLDAAGIQSISLESTLRNTNLRNGNVLTREGSFTRADGTTGQTGELNLAIDTFRTKFASSVAIVDSVRALPNTGGAGNVRSLWEAASLSPSLQSEIARFSAGTTRSDQRQVIDQILTEWARTSGMAPTLSDRASGRYRVEYVAFGNVRRTMATGTIVHAPLGVADVGDTRVAGTFRDTIASWDRRLQALEAFNGQYFFNLPHERSQTPSARQGMTYAAGTATNPQPTLRIAFAQRQLDLLDSAYSALQDSVYRSLVLQTRLKPLLNLIELKIDESGVRLDATALNTELIRRIQTDPVNGLGDLLDLNKYAGPSLKNTNYAGLDNLADLIESIPGSPEIDELLSELGVTVLGDGDDQYSGQGYVLGRDGNDVISPSHYHRGLNAYGGNGDDTLTGSYLDDLLVGGSGNDVLRGLYGANTYVFGVGGGHDTVSDANGYGRAQLGTVRFVGLAPTDLTVTMEFPETIVFTINATGETLRVMDYGAGAINNGIGQYVFDGGVVISNTELKVTLPDGTPGDDFISGSSLIETIVGHEGNDLLVGQEGADTIEGGAGDDTLLGATRWEWEFDPASGQNVRVRSRIADGRPNGNDTYLFGIGDGQDLIVDGDSWSSNLDTLRFKPGVAPTDIQVRQFGGDLVVQILGTDDRVTIRGYYYGTPTFGAIEQFVFEDGTVWDSVEIQKQAYKGSPDDDMIVGSHAADSITGQTGNDLLDGGNGSDQLAGGQGNDALYGGAGSDTLDGGAGDDVLQGKVVSQYAFAYRSFNDIDAVGDTYRFGRGDGHDRIVDAAWLGASMDRIELKDGVAPTDVRLRRAGDDLVVQIVDTSETITVTRFFAGQANQVEEIVFADGTRYDLAEIERQVLVGGAGDDALSGYANRDDFLEGRGGNDHLSGMTGNDTLIGGTGNDTLRGGYGSDTYRFALGDGRDAIEDLQRGADHDVLELGDGILASQVTVRRTMQSDMLLTVNGTTDGIVLSNQFGIAADAGNGVEAIRFADGTEWTRATLAEQAMVATEGKDEIVGGDAEQKTTGSRRLRYLLLRLRQRERRHRRRGREARVQGTGDAGRCELPSGWNRPRRRPAVEWRLGADPVLERMVERVRQLRVRGRGHAARERRAYDSGARAGRAFHHPGQQPEHPDRRRCELPDLRAGRQRHAAGQRRQRLDPRRIGRRRARRRYGSRHLGRGLRQQHLPRRTR